MDAWCFQISFVASFIPFLFMASDYVLLFASFFASSDGDIFYPFFFYPFFLNYMGLIVEKKLLYLN